MLAELVGQLSYACGTTSKKLLLPREKSSQWHLKKMGKLVMKKKLNENTQITNMTQITHKTSIYVQMTQNEYRAHKVDTFGKNTNVA